VVIVSDGLPWDVDVHDPQYLVSDAHDAVMRARPTKVSNVSRNGPSRGGSVWRVPARSGHDRLENARADDRFQSAAAIGSVFKSATG
jgi:hypothetical protein